MNNQWLKSATLALIVFVSAFSIAAQNKISVRVAAETRIEGDSIKLGDIAQIADAGEKSERLKNVALGYAPNVGMTRELTRERIALAIAAAGFTASEFSLVAPHQIRVQRAGQQVSQTQIRAALEKAVSDLFASKEVSAKIIRLDLPAKIEIPVGEVDVRVNLDVVRSYFAPFSAPVEIRLNNSVVRRLAATVEIEAFADVFVAARDLSTTDKIGEADVRRENRRLQKPLVNYLRDAEKLGGLKLIKNISNGAEITNDLFAARVVVKFGDPVRIVGQSGKLQISVAGEARGTGKIGDRVAVKNLQSNVVLQAVVVDEGLVKIIF